MRRHIAAALTAIALIVPPVQAVNWDAVAPIVEKSIVVVETERGLCTGFVINTDADEKEDRDYIATANHCEGPKLYADNSPARIVSKVTKQDLLVLEVEDTGRPALKLAKEDPKTGEEVASYGYGYGFERPMFRVTHIADNKTYIPEDGIGGPFFVTDATFVPGQSGGPVVNADGEVVMMVQMGTNSVGIGVGAETIKSKIGKYFEKAKGR